jgi:hypothetical protein
MGFKFGYNYCYNSSGDRCRSTGTNYFITFPKKLIMPAYDTLTEALQDMKSRGFTTDFNLAFDNIQCQATGICLRPEEFEITEHYRFEADTNPSDSSVVYGIQAKDGSMKGVLVNAYGVYSESASDNMIRKLSVHETP